MLIQTVCVDFQQSYDICMELLRVILISSPVIEGFGLSLLLRTMLLH